MKDNTAKQQQRSNVLPFPIKTSSDLMLPVLPRMEKNSDVACMTLTYSAFGFTSGEILIFTLDVDKYDITPNSLIIDSNNELIAAGDIPFDQIQGIVIYAVREVQNA